MADKKRHPLVIKLKSGEYDGADIMEAWLLIEAQQAKLEDYKDTCRQKQEIIDCNAGILIENKDLRDKLSQLSKVS